MSTTHPYVALRTSVAPGTLLLTPCPGIKGTSIREAVEALKGAGASAVLTLMTDEEMTENNAESLPLECARQGIHWYHLPIVDGQAPEKSALVKSQPSLDKILGLIQNGSSVAIHCRGGSGRTGLIAAQILIIAGLPTEDAIRLVKDVKPNAFSLSVHRDYIATVSEATKESQLSA